jgi:anti-sigma factor RsiW
MAECIDIQAELSAYLDGELTAQERSSLDAHLSTCPECRAMLEELRGVASVMSDLPRVSAPASLMTKVRRDIASEPTLREQTKTAVAFSTIDRGNARPRVHWAPFAFGMAALVLLCLLAFLILPAISHDKVALETTPARSAAAPAVAQDEAPAEKEAALRKIEEIAPSDAKKSDDAIGAALEQNELKKSVAPDAENRRGADKAGAPAAKNDAFLKDRAADAADPRAKDMQAQRKRVEEKLDNAAPVPPAVQAPPPGAVSPRAPAPVATAPEPPAPPAPTATRRRDLQPRDPEARALRSEAMEKQKSSAPERKNAGAAFGNGLDADKNVAIVEEKAEKSAGTAAPKPEAKPFADADNDGKRANLPPQKPAEYKVGANKPVDALKLAEAGQQGGQKAGEELARERQQEQAKSQTIGAPRDGAATGGLAAKGEAKDSKADANALNRAEQNGQPAQNLAGGGRGGGVTGKAEPAPKTPMAAAKALVLQQNQAAETKVVRVHAKDLQRAIGDLKKIVEANGGRWEDVAMEAEGKAKEAEGGKPSVNARREAASAQPSSYVAVTSADKSDALLAQLNAYDKSRRQLDAGNAPAFGADEARKEAAGDRDLADKPALAKKAAKKELSEEDRPVAKPLAPAKAAPGAPTAAASAPEPVNAGETRIQIRIEIIAE